MNTIIIIDDFDIKFSDSDLPKPFYLIQGRPLIDWTISSLNFPGSYFIGIHRKYLKYIPQLEAALKGTGIDYNIIVIEDSEGEAHDVLMVTEVIRKRFNQDAPIIVAPAYQYFNWDCKKFLSFVTNGFDSVIGLYPFDDIEENSVSNYSHVRLNMRGMASELADNFAISFLALNGLYYYRDVREFQDSVNQLIREASRLITLSEVCNNLIKYAGTVAPYRISIDELIPLNTGHDIFEFNLMHK